MWQNSQNWTTKQNAFANPKFDHLSKIDFWWLHCQEKQSRAQPPKTGISVSDDRFANLEEIFLSEIETKLTTGTAFKEIEPCSISTDCEEPESGVCECSNIDYKKSLSHCRLSIRSQRTSVATDAQQSGTGSPFRQRRELCETKCWINGNATPKVVDQRPQESREWRKFSHQSSCPSHKLHFFIPKDRPHGDQKNHRWQQSRLHVKCNNPSLQSQRKP